MAPTPSSSSRHAVVAGAGPGGATTALLLAATGWRVTLLERVAEPTAVGAGLLLQPNGLAVLDALGLHDALHTRAHEIRGAAVRNHRGQTLLRTRVPDMGSGLDHLLALPRSHLAEVLGDAIAAAPSIELRTGTEVVAATADGTVTGRSGDDEHELTAEIVVAADGVRSRVRATAGLAATLHDTAHTYLRAIVRAPSDAAPSDEQAEHWTPIGLFGASPLGDGTTYFFADADAPSVRAALAARDLDAVRRAWSSVLPAAEPYFAAVASIDDLLVNQVQRVDAPSFRSGCVALLGDAAHAMAPNLGQGANSALVDAAVLAQELARAQGVADALDAYDARRRPAVQKVQRDADRVARAAGLRHGLARGLRDAVISHTPASAGERRFRAAQQEDPAALLAALRGLVG